jgi:hypothetical protein
VNTTLPKRRAFTSQEKYIGMDVHAATISPAVMNAEGKLPMECVLETKAATIPESIQGLRGTLAGDLVHDLLQPHVSRLVVCGPRKNALMRDGNQNDRADARNVAELLRTNQVHQNLRNLLKRAAISAIQHPGAAAGFLRRPGGERDAAQHGSSRLAQKIAAITLTLTLSRHSLALSQTRRRRSRED